MNKEISVSVLMPAYNAERYLADSIESILNQTFKNFELIVIDDCSRDNTKEILQKYSKKDKRINAVYNEKNLDIAENRNKALKLAKGRYIAWQDADDISLPNRLMHQKEYLDKNPRVGIVGGYLDFFSDTSEYVSTRKYCEKDSEIRKKIFRYAPVAQPAAMIRMECFKKVGKFNKNVPVAEDLDMNFRIGEYYEFANLQESVIRYRVNYNSSTFKRLREMESHTISIRKKYFENQKYRATLADKIYNYLQWVSIFLIPPKIKISIFNFLRNYK